MTNVRVHRTITIVLSILFLTSLVWTFNTNQENRSLATRNETLELTVVELRNINEQYQAYYVNLVDSLKSANITLDSTLRVKSQQLKVISDRAQDINKKYTRLYEVIKVSDDIVDQYSITEQLLAEQQRLVERQEN